MLLLDGGLSFQYDGKAGTVIAMMMMDFLLKGILTITLSPVTLLGEQPA